MNTFKPLVVPTDEGSAKDFGFEPCEGGVCAAEGMLASGVSAGFRKNPDRRDLALVASERTCTCAATFTQNRFCAAPVQVSREHAKLGRARAVVLNSGNANAATGAAGLKTAKATAQIVASALGCDEREILVASTGVIGLQLSTEHFVTGVPLATHELAHSAEAAHNAALAVMTTDTHPKECSVVGVVNGHTVHVGGFVKGSGMIQPNMATMLAVVSTDAPLTGEAAHAMLLAAVRHSFNKVTVDSDTSTNDSCFFFATGEAGGEPIGVGDSGYDAVAAAVRYVCDDLARNIAADGEGSTKLVTVDVMGAANQEDADTVARSIANSPLVKTAIFGHDANWGRVAAAAGKCGVPFDQSQVDIDFLGVPVCRKGLDVPMDEADMLERFKSDEVDIAVNLGMGLAHTRIWTCDLTHDYVKINGEYRT